MNKNARLFIGDKEVEFSENQSIEIAYNYNLTDVSSPTAVKNSFSKTITIEGTNANNDIFGHFWNLDRYQIKMGGTTGAQFNPAQRVSFRLFINDDLVEQGYVKLDNVKKNNGRYQYDITLYGGLGEFFYNLAYDEEGEKRTLGDLTFYDTGGTSAITIGFQINKETLIEAWNHNIAYGDSKWDIINFAPSYNGIPKDNFSPDKVLWNMSGQDVYDTTISGYSTTNGYSVITLPQGVTEWEARDMRASQQRPVINVRRVIEACCNPNNNGGYEVDLDTTKWFIDDNPYWNNLWMTLPKLTEIDFPSSYTEEDLTTSLVLGAFDSNGYASVTVSGGTFTNARNASLNTTLTLDSSSNTLYLYPNTYTRNNVTDGETYGTYNYTYASPVFLQLIAYDSDGNVADKSVCYMCVSNTPSGTEQTITPQMFSSSLNAPEGTTFKVVKGRFKSVNGSYTFCDYDNGIYTFPLKLESDASFSNLKLRVVRVAVTNTMDDISASTCYTTPWYEFDGAQSDVETMPYRNSAATSNLKAVMSNGYMVVSNTGLTGQWIGKDLILNTSYSPMDFLLSYCKLFGLMFSQDAYDKKVHIMSRGTYYNRDTIVDLTDRIDISQDIDITPLTTEYKWYDWEFEREGNALCADDYKTSNGVEYGVKRVNTGYIFNKEAKKVLEDIVFKGGIEVLEMSDNYFMQIDGWTMPYVLNNGYYSLTKNSGDTLDVSLNKSYVSWLSPINADHKYYDLFSKVQFRDKDNAATDGANVLVFFNGFVEPMDENVVYAATDDMPEMYNMVGNPCWFMTTWDNDTGSTATRDGVVVARKIYGMPLFQRYRKSGDNIILSLDFGNPRSLYFPDANMKTGTSIYDKCWKAYFEDMYNINTKMMTANVLIDNKPNDTWLRQFYWYDNSLWRLNSIVDWNPLSYDTTKCEFVKVQSLSNYDSSATTATTMSLTLNPQSVGSSGGSVSATLNISDGGDWWFEPELPDGVVAMKNGSAISGGTGNSNFTLVVSAWTGTTARTLDIYVMSDNASVHKTITQESAVPARTISVSPSYAGFESTGGTKIITITSNGDWTTDTIDHSWITITPSTGTSAVTSALLSAGTNSSALEVEGYVVFRNGNASARTQYEQVGQVAISVVETSSSDNIPATGGSATYRVKSTANWRASSTASYVSISPTAGTGNTTSGEIVTVTFDENTTETARTATIVFTNTGYYESVSKTKTQDAASEAYGTVSPTTLTYNSSGATKTITIDTNQNVWWITMED